MIRVNKLNKYFNRFKKNEIHVLNDITLDFPDRGLVVLLGPSGSGKTTLLNVLGGLDKVQSGTIDFDMDTIEGYDTKTWDKIRNEAVGYIFQNYNLLPELSVFDNIAFVLKMIGIQDPEIIEKRVNYILHAVNMYPFRKKRALQLSGGQQQRVAIARALVKNPRIIIADEPTGNLDSKNTQEIMNIIKQISLEKLVVLVTHEKDIARFYGDRIIELKDGQIISDSSNDQNNEHQFTNEDIIYLKDLNQLSDQNDNHLETALYSDHPEEEKIEVKLIVKNKTLYLDVKTNYKKIKLIDQHSAVVIKDEHFVKKTREEMIETSFDSEELDNRYIERTPKLLVSTKQILWLAFRKIMNTSRRGKLMLFSFFIAGIVISFTISFLSATIIIDAEQNLPITRNHIQVIQTNDEDTYDDLLNFQGASDESFYINTLGNADFYLETSNENRSRYSVSAKIDLYDQIKDKDLSAGRLPQNKNEALVSKGYAETWYKEREGQELGIWSVSHLLRESFLLHDEVVDIVGVVDTDILIVYLERDMANYFVSLQNFSANITIYEILKNDLTIVAGTAPDENSILIPESTYQLITGGTDYTGTWPKTLLGFPYSISGVYQSEDVSNYLMTSDLAEKIRFETSNSFFIRTDFPSSLKDIIENETDLTAIDIYQEALNQAKQQRNLVLYSSLGTAGFIIGFALLGFFFIIRSSLISRIYEISVYRALGVKKNEIFRSFLIEIIVLTSISTLVGYVIGSVAISKLQEGLLGEFNFFKITPLTFLLGLVLMYLINVLAGLFPVYMLLRKTPAQILSQYDI